MNMNVAGIFIAAGVVGLIGLIIALLLGVAGEKFKVEVDEKDKEKTAFICSRGLFEFNVMPFGLCNAPATFQRMMDEVLGELDRKIGRDYIDDLIIGSKTFDQHLEDLEKLFTKLGEYNLKIKLNKCVFARSKVIYLGHEVSIDGVAPNPEKVEAISKMKPPTDISGLRRFLGLTSYYRRFIKDYSKIAHPLNERLMKNRIYNWDKDCQEAFEELKRKLMTKPILCYPDFEREFHIHTDASKFGLGAVLTQTDESGKEKVIMYLSRTLNKAERQYTVTERECLAVVWAVDKLRHYIYGRRVIVITDHAALKWLFNIKNPEGRLARWGLKLQAHDMEIRHRPGAVHRNADALSRIDEDNVIKKVEEIEKVYQTNDLELKEIFQNQREEISIAQHNDEEFGLIIQHLEGHSLPDIDEKKKKNIIIESAAYELADGLLYRVLPITRRSKELPKEFRLAVPWSMRSKLLQQYHNSIFGAHLGRKKTYKKLSQLYFWRGMFKDISKWISECKECNLRKGVPDIHRGEMMTYSSSKPWETVGIDVVGPLPKTFRGNKYLLVFTDHFSKWVEVFAMPDQKMTMIAEKFLGEVVSRYGAFQRIVTDRGPNFVGNLITELTKQLEIKHSTTTPYHPQTNGVTERFNKTLINMLAMYTSYHLKDWDVYLPYVLLAYRTAVHSSTGETPYKVMFGREATLPTDLNEIRIKDKESITPKEYGNQLMEDLTMIWKEVKEYDNLVKQKREADSLKTHKPSDYEVGDLVYLYIKPSIKGAGKKLRFPWRGPYKVVEKIGTVNVKIQGMSGKMLEQVVHVNRLKKYKTFSRPQKEPILVEDNFNINEPAIQETEECEIPELDNKVIEEKRKEKAEKNATKKPKKKSKRNEEYEVEKIEDLKIEDGERQFLVKWKGYGREEMTWEPEGNLTHAKTLKNEFFERNKMLCRECGYQAISQNGLKYHLKEHKN